MVILKKLKVLSPKNILIAWINCIEELTSDQLFVRTVTYINSKPPIGLEPLIPTYIPKLKLNITTKIDLIQVENTVKLNRFHIYFVSVKNHNLCLKTMQLQNKKNEIKNIDRYFIPCFLKLKELHMD